MAMITWFSTSDFSAENTGSVLKPLLRWLLPGLTAPQLDAVHAVVRKSAHVTEYAMLAALWFVALTRERGLAPRRAAWLAFLVAVGWAFLDELHQATEPSRTASAMDVAIDAMGALAASTIGRHGWGCTPRPRNDSADSITITRAMSSVATTSHGVKTFGSTWRSRMRPSRLPSACAACTNSRSRSESAAPRTMRAYTTQLETPITQMIVVRLGPSTPMTAMASRMNGNASWMSASRISTSSIRPPK